MCKSLTIRLLVLVSLLLTVGATGAVEFKETAGADIPAAGSSAKIIAGPYVQQVTTTGATIMWQTATASEDKLSVLDRSKWFTYACLTRRCLHTVKVHGLAPDTTYKYQVSAAQGVFRTYPDKPGPVKFVVYGDSRSNPKKHKSVIDAMAKEPGVDFVLHTGDVVANGNDLDSWIPMYFAPAAAMIRKVSFYPVLGNHESNSSNYFTYFSLPGNERYYSFDVLNVHIIALDSNTDFDQGSDQYDWLIKDLNKHKNAKWKFILMHTPVFSSGNHGGFEGGVPSEKPMRTAQKLIPSLARKYGITAVFSGHDHAYERNVKDGVEYIVSGGGGAGLYGKPNAENNPYSKLFLSGNHYCVITVGNGRPHLVAKSPSGKIIDEVDL
ncbi:MAG: purple acid phosphatase family protein [Armatimonadota bacterium]